MELFEAAPWKSGLLAGLSNFLEEGGVRGVDIEGVEMACGRGECPVMLEEVEPEMNEGA